MMTIPEVRETLAHIERDELLSAAAHADLRRVMKWVEDLEDELIRWVRGR
jgi:hypothetical protein